MSLAIDDKRGKVVGPVITGILAVAAAVLGITGVNNYNDHQQDKQATEASQQAAVKSEAAKDAAEEAKEQANIAKLYSICIEAQETYDGMSAAEKAKTTRPDCNVAK